MANLFEVWQINPTAVRYVLFFYVIDLPLNASQCIWSNGQHINTFPHSSFLHDFFSIHDTRFRWSFISAGCSVFPDTLIDLFLNLNTFYSRYSSRACIINIRPPSFQSFHQFVNFPLVYAVTVILIRHFSVNVTIFTSSDHKIWLFIGVFCAVYQWRDRIKRCNENQLDANGDGNIIRGVVVEYQDGGSTVLRNVGIQPPQYTAQHFRKTTNYNIRFVPFISVIFGAGNRIFRSIKTDFTAWLAFV